MATVPSPAKHVIGISTWIRAECLQQNARNNGVTCRVWLLVTTLGHTSSILWEWGSVDQTIGLS